MKKILLFLCTMLCANLLLAQTSFADEEAETSTGIRRTRFWVGDLQYEVTSTNPAEVEVNDAGNGYITTAIIPETVNYEGTTYSVTSIGDGAFSGLSSLTSIDIPESVTSIGDWAFVGCGITSIDIPNGVTSIGGWAFQYCSSLTSVTIPNSVTSIGESAFYKCSSLTSVILPNNADISLDAFFNTGGIKNVDGIYYGGTETVNIGNYTFNNVGFITFYLDGNVYTITPSEVSVINYDDRLSGYYAESLSGDIVILETVSYGGTTYSVTSIGDWAFDGCRGLTSVTIPNSVTSIREGAFWSCNSLTSVTIGNSVTSIGWGAFAHCSSLTSIGIGNGVTSIENYAFSYCSSLTSVTIPNSVTSIGDWAFEGCI